MAYKKTTEKYVGSVKTIYVSYKESHIHSYHGHRKSRTQIRVKKIYVPGKLLKCQVGTFTNRKGRRVKGVKVTYRNPVRGAGRYGAIKSMKISKVIPLPTNAKNIRVHKKLPKKLRGPLMAVT